jgi:putative colanic acid biosynthesis UDP-glucose lipid carrier transferase
MPKRLSRRVAADVVGFLDILAVVCGSIMPAAIYAAGGGIAPKWATVIQIGLVTAIVAHGCLRNWNMYDTRKMHDFPVDPARLLGALALAFMALLGLGMPFGAGQAHMWIWYAAWMSTSFTLLLWNRIMARMVLSNLTRAGRFDMRVAVFGAGVIARRVHDHLVDPRLGISFAGVYDDRKDQGRLNPEGLVVTGRLEDLIADGREGLIDQVVIALPQAADRRASEIARRLEQLPVSLHIVTHLASDLVEVAATHKVSSLGSIGMLDVKHPPLTDWAPVVKRCMDCVLGSALLVLSLPLMALAAIAIKLESKGPVLFWQRRGGLNQKVIEVVKFRSMTVLENGSDVPQAKANDCRVTRVGRVLRRFSLDELPQLWNVLRGEMSLVGPRPHALAHDSTWAGQLDCYTHRQQVKPGLTGLAQVKGLRGEVSTSDSIEGRVQQDIAYIHSWSPGLDLRILAKTFWVVLQGRNAH